MRSRGEIEKLIKLKIYGDMLQMDPNRAQRLMIELLLDIRDMVAQGARRKAQSAKRRAQGAKGGKDETETG